MECSLKQCNTNKAKYHCVVVVIVYMLDQNLKMH